MERQRNKDDNLKLVIIRFQAFENNFFQLQLHYVFLAMMVYILKENVTDIQPYIGVTQ